MESLTMTAVTDYLVVGGFFFLFSQRANGQTPFPGNLGGLIPVNNGDMAALAPGEAAPGKKNHSGENKPPTAVRGAKR